MTIRTYESLPSAAARIGVSVKTIRRRIAEGVLPVVRSGRSLHLDPKDVDALLRRYPQHTRPSSVQRHVVQPDARRQRVPRPSKAQEEAAGFPVTEGELASGDDRSGEERCPATSARESQEHLPDSVVIQPTRPR